MGSMKAEEVRGLAEEFGAKLNDPRRELSTMTGNTRAKKYSKANAEMIFECLGAGYTVIEACDAVGIHDSTVRLWRTPGHPTYNPEFSKAFEVAYKWGAHALEYMAFKLSMDVSGDKYEDVNKDGIRIMKPDSARVNARRLAVDTLYRMAGKRDKSFLNKDTDSSNDQRPITFLIQQFGSGKTKKVEVVKEAQITESKNNE